MEDKHDSIKTIRMIVGDRVFEWDTADFPGEVGLAPVFLELYTVFCQSNGYPPAHHKFCPKWTLLNNQQIPCPCSCHRATGRVTWSQI